MNASNLRQSGPHLPGGVPSAHVDRYVYSLMPPPESWPVFDYSGDGLAGLPDYLNAAAWLIDSAVAEGHGSKAVMHFEGRSWSYRHLLEQANRIARVLVEDYGLVPGTRVLLRSGNCPMLAACWLAVLKAGGICVTTMPLLRSDELRFILDRVRIRIALCDVSLAGELEDAKRSADTLERIACFTPVGEVTSRSADLERAMECKPASFANVRTAADDIALITFTSGTTGNPKAAVHFHRDIAAITECYPRVDEIRPDDVVCGSPSVAFTFGLAVFLIYPLRYRAAVAYLRRPAPDQILGAVEQYGATSLYCVPTSYRQMLEGLDRFNIGTLRKCVSSGENMPLPLWEAWRQQTGLRLVNGFGATELMCTVLSESATVDRTGSTGRPTPGYTIRLIDDEGQALPLNSKGRIAIRGPTGCRYLDDLDQQRTFVQDGWNVTGDIFVRDGDGFFWYVDRSDDIIVSAGYNISPQEVERAMVAHPLVRECAVVGVDDARRGKLVRACVVLNEGASPCADTVRALQDFVKNRIAPYKYPRDIRFYDELPKTHTGKIQRRRLRQD